jgi:hypothetical protein
VRRIAFLAIFVVAGCGSGGSNGSGAREDVEGIIRSQLPGSVRRSTGEAVFVNKVTCVDKGGGEYGCVASVSGTDGVGGLQKYDVVITASCDERNCTWRVE